MLKITVEGYVRRSKEDSTPTRTLKLEGKLIGPWVEELERVWNAVTSEQAAKHVVVDLCDVLFVDAEGRKLLERMYQQGARLEASGCVMNSFIEEIERGCKRR